MSLKDMFAFLKNSVSVPAIEHSAFVEAHAAGQCHVIDVREPHEFAAGHVPNARNLPLSRFDVSKLPKDKPVVLLCQAGGRSASALRKAHAAGRTDVVHYAPGTGGWVARGGAVTKGG